MQQCKTDFYNDTSLEKVTFGNCETSGLVGDVLRLYFTQGNKCFVKYECGKLDFGYI